MGIGKILQISIPKVRLKNRDIDFVVDFIRRTSRDLNEEGVGLNIVVGNIGKKTINLDLDDIPIRELLNYVCDQADLKLVVKNNAILISNNQNSNP
ncbi:MAG: hypothetical protein MK132_26390 [Lentisphaerales bacterium]|nr:hypothetical protein [Lentisphaerales bacterium]